MSNTDAKGHLVGLYVTEAAIYEEAGENVNVPDRQVHRTNFLRFFSFSFFHLCCSRSFETGGTKMEKDDDTFLCANKDLAIFESTYYDSCGIVC